MDSEALSADANGTADLVPAQALLLAEHDRSAAMEIDKSSTKLGVTSVPHHPGSDPVSLRLVDALATTLRGPGGITAQLTALSADLRDQADELEAAYRTYLNAEVESADAFNRLRDQQEDY